MIKKLAKIAVCLLAVVFIAAPVLADDEPEFDAVGLDSANIFALGNTTLNGIINHMDYTLPGYPGGIAINTLSDWDINPGGYLPSAPFDVALGGSQTSAVGPARMPVEFFATSAFPNIDPCFADYVSYKADTWNRHLFVWQIVLQKKPQSDINLDIVDCVMKNQGRDPWTTAAETGVVRSFTGQLLVSPSLAPTVNVYAIPGPNAMFTAPFGLYAYQMPGLSPVFLGDPGASPAYLSKAFFDENLVLQNPSVAPAGGIVQAPLYAGDMIRVVVTVPQGHPNDLYYGKQNVLLKYIGIVGTEFISS